MEQQANETNTDELPSFPPSTDISPRTVTLGLITAPEIAEQITRDIIEEIPGQLRRHVDDQVHWEVTSLRDASLGAAQDAGSIFDTCRERREEREWNYAISITDLPLYRNGQITVADVSYSHRTGQISIPALGVVRLRRLTRDIAIQIVAELHSQRSGTRSETTSTASGDTSIKGPIGLQRDPDEDMSQMGVDVRFVETGPRGHIRLWSGMVYANHPFKLFLRFKGAIAAAFATGAYALLIPSVWRLTEVSTTPRLIALMVASFIAMIGWLIVGHNLWERTGEGESRPLTVLYNWITVLTLFIAVTFAYGILFLLLIVTELIFIPRSLIQSTLQQTIGVTFYLHLAWVATSVATVAGALGAGFEDDDTVRDAAFGYRQKRRNQNNDAPGEE